MRRNAEKGEFEGEAIDEAEEDLDAYDDIYHAREKPFGKHCMLFDKL